MSGAKLKLPPTAVQDMRARWKAGDPMAQIAASARRLNGLSKEEVRAIIFGTDHDSLD